jgi:hypothetical protein
VSIFLPVHFNEVRTIMMSALLCAFLTILTGNIILAGAGDTTVSVLERPVLSLHVNSQHSEVARSVSASIHLLEDDRRLQGGNFQNFCDIVEESGPYSCDCNATSLLAVCDSSQVCNRDTCATFHVVNTFDAAYNLVSVQTCAEYTVQIAAYRNGCVNFTLIENGEIFDTCEMAFVDDSGVLTKCNECLVCDGRVDVLTFDLDCSNIDVEASSSECINIEEEIFPGFQSSANGGKPVSLVGAAAVVTLVVGLYI